MNDVKVKLIINVELTNLDAITRIEKICTELSLAPEEFISKAININSNILGLHTS